MPGEKRPVPLSKDIHEDGQTTNADLDTSNNRKDVPDAALDQPVVAAEGQAEGKDVFEHEQAGKGLDGHVAVGVDEVQRAGDGA